MKFSKILSRVFLPFSFLVVAVLFLPGCIVGPASLSGGIGATTVTDSNPTAIISAANEAFASAGYSMGPVDFPVSASFDKHAGSFGQAMYGGWNDSVTYRATMSITPLSGGNDYRIGVKVKHVNETGMAGMDDTVPMSGLWSAEFAPILQQIRKQASGAGGY